MAPQPFSPVGLQLQLEATSNETIVHCKGKITAENSELFQRQIRDLIPEPRAQVAAITRRIIIDLRQRHARRQHRFGCAVARMDGSQKQGMRP